MSSFFGELMKLSRIDKIIDWGYDDHSLWNIPAMTIRIGTGLYCGLGGLIRFRRGIARGEMEVVD